MMRLVIIESPYAEKDGVSVDEHVAYARRAMVDSLMRGEAPIASHLLYTQPGILDDAITAERQRGIEAGLAWARRADAAAFYVDYGWSVGMSAAMARHGVVGVPVEHRYIGRN